jgi:hypothetical protein
MNNSPDDSSDSPFEATHVIKASSDTQETVSRAHAAAVAAQESAGESSRLDSGSRKARVAIVAGGKEMLSDQERETLRARLFAGTLVILFGFAIYLVRSYFDDRPLQGFHTLVVLALTAFAGLLSSRRELSTKELRLVELGAFGIPVIFFVPYQ